MIDKNKKNNILPTVTIAISCHNEERHIARLLQQIMAQNALEFTLESVVIACDGCTDNTYSEAQRIAANFQIINVINDGERLGKIARFNQFFKSCRSDIMIVFDGDIILYDNNVIRELVSGINSHESGLVGGIAVPATPKNFFQKIVVNWSTMWHVIRFSQHNKLSVHNFSGCVLALSRAYYSNLNIPTEVIAEDEFMFFDSQQKGYKPTVALRARVSYESVDSLHEYILQSTRFMMTRYAVQKYFDKNIQDYYAVATTTKISELLKTLIAHPVLTSCGIFIQIYIRSLKSINKHKSFDSYVHDKNNKHDKYDKKILSVPQSLKSLIACFSTKSYRLVRNTLYKIAGVIDRLFPPHNPSLVVLCYHSVAKDQWRFSIDPNELKNQVLLLLKTHTPVSVSDAYTIITGQTKLLRNSFLITFDDGYEDVLNLKSFFMNLNIKPTLFVLSQPELANRVELDTERSFLTTEQILDLYGAGWDIGCHSATHANFFKLTPQDIVKEIITSKGTLEKKLGISIDYFAYPKGAYTQSVIAAVQEAGYKLGFSVDDRIVRAGINLYTVPRIGVDRTHSSKQFRALFSPAALFLKSNLKKVYTFK